jgi:hypothetical protein
LTLVPRFVLLSKPIRLLLIVERGPWPLRSYLSAQLIRSSIHLYRAADWIRFPICLLRAVTLIRVATRSYLSAQLIRPPIHLYRTAAWVRFPICLLLAAD